MNKIVILSYSIVFILFTIKAYSHSSSYLIANSAFEFFDYNDAKIHYVNFPEYKLDKIDLEKKMFVFVNTNLLEEASNISKKILKLEHNNKEAWAVYLTNAMILNIKEPFDEFKKVEKTINSESLNYWFYDKKNNIRKKEEVAMLIVDMLDTFIEQNKNNFHAHKYLLFYLSLSTILDNNFNEGNYFIAQIYQNLKKYDQATKYYRLVNTNHDLYIESQKNLAIIKSLENQYDEAEKILFSLIKDYPNNSDLLFAMSHLYQNNKKYKKAIEGYSKLLKSYNIDIQTRAQIYYFRGICYEKNGKWNSAEKDFLNSLKINSESSKVLNYLAYSWIERNMFIERSLDMLKTAHEKNPDSHYILDSLAWAHYKSNNLTIASELMEQVINMAPSEVISIDHLGDIYLSLGRKREAIYMWNQAMDLSKPSDDIYQILQIKINKYNAG